MSRTGKQAKAFGETSELGPKQGREQKWAQNWASCLGAMAAGTKPRQSPRRRASGKENSGAAPLDQLQGFLFCGDSALQAFWIGSCSHEQR